jgi:hypothetical protein
LEILGVLADVMGLPYKLRDLQKNFIPYPDLYEALAAPLPNAVKVER